MKRLLIATKNIGKFGEICAVLHKTPFKLCSLEDLNLNDEVEETGQTHEENAILKARYFFKKTGMPTLGEDSGIYVDAFPDALGVQTRRWGGLEKATDKQWIAYFLQQMEQFQESKRGARFVCFAALILNDESFQKPHIFSGETRGVITRALEAPLKSGIPVSSCFKPDGFKKVYAALTPAEKNRVSHRGKAMHACLDFLSRSLLLRYN